MKLKNHLLQTLLFCTIVLLAHVGCKKEESCPTGYEGENCDVEIKPKSVSILSVKLTKFPAQTPDGMNWDENVNPEFVNPDIFLAIVRDSDSTVLWTSTAFNDVAPGTTRSYSIASPGLEVDPDEDYVVVAIDFDGAGTAPENDYIGGIIGKFYQPGAGFPGAQKLECSGCEVSFEVEVVYRY